MNESLRLGLLPVRLKALEGALCLPEGYSIVGVSYDAERHILNLTLLSAQLPVLPENRYLPQLSLHVTERYLPGQSPDYRKITTEVKVL